jgi:hypothetical protein
MGSALGQMLPYAIGLLVSPIPIAAVAMLIAGREGTRKGIIFCVTWWLVSFVAVLVLSVLAGLLPRTPGVAPGWDSAMKIFLGVMLLIWAVLCFIRILRGQRHSPRTLERLVELPPDRLAEAVARLLLVDPLRLIMLIAAALELGSHQLSPAADVLMALVFAIVGTLAVLLPALLPALKRPSTSWLLRHNDLPVLITSLCFGAALLVNGLRQL